MTDIIKKDQLYATPWGPLGYITYKRTYARHLNEDHTAPTEEYAETVDRIMRAADEQLKVGFTEEERERVRSHFLALKCSTAGRFLWQLGTKTVEKLGLLSLQNCAFCVVDDPIRPFTWAFDALMLGSGVGYNIQREFVYELPKVKHDVVVTRVDTKDADFIVPDSREGWVELLRRVLEAHFITGKSFSYSTICIRSKGTPIKGFGGTASGPEELCWGMAEISKVLNERAGKKVRPIDCLDVMNIIGYVVVSGNVRRCLPKDAQVHTKSGLMNIQDVLPGTEVLTTKGYKRVSNRFIQGKQKTITIKTQDGAFECTPNHRMAVLTSLNEYTWVEAQDLKSGDRLISTYTAVDGAQTSLPRFSYSKPAHSTTCQDITIPELDADMAWLIGLFHADGYTYANRADNGFNAYVSIVVGEHEEDIAQKAAAQLRRFGLDNVKVFSRKNERSLMIHVQSKQLAWYFDEFLKKPNVTIRVPGFIKQATNDVRLAYLAGVADGDGSLGNRPAVVTSTVYEDFAKDLQNLLYSCGIMSRLNIETEDVPSRAGWQKIHSVSLNTLRSRSQFGAIPQLSKDIPTREKSQRSNGFPESFIGDGKTRRLAGLGQGATQSQQINIDTFESIYGEVQYVPVEVVEIGDGREVETYDIEVEDVHEFFCNGYLTHNSAQIAIGDFDDRDFLKAKRWDLGNIPNWRAMSNNSVVCNDFSKLPDEFWDGYIGKGEPYGLINLKLSRKVGRLGDDRYPDKDVHGYNPSLRRGTKVWTSDGIKEIQDLQDKEFIVNNLKGEPAEAKCWLSGNNKELYEITLENGFKYYSTPEHKWPIYTDRGYVRCETTELKPGHMLPITQRDSLEFGSKGSYDDGFAIGWLYGDGWTTTRKDNGKTQYGWIFSNEDIESGLSEKIKIFLERVTGNKHEGSHRDHGIEFNSANDELHSFMTEFGVSHKSSGLPAALWSKASEGFRKGFIDALFSSDGTVDSSYKGARLMISQSNKKMISDIAELLGFYGIKNSMDTLVVKNAVFPSGKDDNKEYTRHSLRITTRQSIEHFRKTFNLSHAKKQKKLNEITKGSTKPLWGSHYMIKSVVKTDLKEDVWDVAVYDDTHCFQLSQCVTGNCGEQSLNDKETCALGEVFLPNITSKEEMIDVVTSLYRIIKHSLKLPCHLKETERVVHKNMRMGIGVTGYLQATEEQKSWLPDVYEALRAFDKEYSRQHGFPTSIKLSTVKPSGTLSLLAGVTSGVHPGYSRHYIRRIRISSASPLVDLCRKHGYHVEYQKQFDGTEDHNTVVVSFPCKHDDDTVIAADVSAIDQMEFVKRLQADWSDNSVSCTVYYKKEELDGIKEWLAKNYNQNVKTISFLLHSEHGFIQAPLEEISADEYERLRKGTKPITGGGELKGDEGIDLSECIGGACPIR